MLSGAEAMSALRSPAQAPRSRQGLRDHVPKFWLAMPIDRLRSSNARGDTAWTMSEENVAIVRRVIDYVNETGEAGPLELYDAAVTFTTRGDLGGPETFTGHRGMVDAVARFGEVWAKTAAHIIELIEDEDVVVAVVRFELLSKTGVELDVEEAWAYWLRDGKLTRIEQHGSRGKALEAAGLSE